MKYIFLIVFVLTCVFATTENDFTIALYADPHVGSSTGEKMLSKAVSTTNNLVSSNNIKYVIILGDLTHRSTIDQYAKARLLLDDLTIPYIPIIGNHDLHKDGEKRFIETFQKIIQKHATKYNPHEIMDPIENITSNYQNWYLNYGGIHWISLDFGCRVYSNRLIRAAVDLHDFAGGTLDWLSKTLSFIKSKTEQIVLLQHYPTQCIPFQTFKNLFCFNNEKLKRFQQVLEYSGHPADQFFGVFAGHTHWYSNTIAFEKGWGSENLKLYIGGAIKRGWGMMLVNVSQSKITNVERIKFDQEYKMNIFDEK